jgi:hypothetical protein
MTMLSSNLMFKVESDDFLKMTQQSTLPSNDVLIQRCFGHAMRGTIVLRHFVLYLYSKLTI